MIDISSKTKGYLYQSGLFTIALIIGCIFIGKFSIYAVFGGIIVSQTYKADMKLLKALLIVYILQNIALILLSDIINANITTYLITIKEQILFFTTFISLIFYKKLKVDKFFCVSVLFGMVLIGSFFTSDATAMAKITSVRQLIIPFLAFYFGRSLFINDEREIKDIVLFFVKICIFIALFGFFERFILGDNFWTEIGTRQFAINKGQQMYYTEAGIMGSYYTYDLAAIFNKAIRRLVSITAEPLSTAHILSLGFIMLLFLRKSFSHKFFVVSSIIIGLGIILGISKGAFLIVILSCIIYAMDNVKNKKYVYYVLSVFMILGIIIIGLNVGKNTSIGYHLDGFIDGIKNISILGHGIGKSGLNGLIYGNTGTEVLTAESTFGSILGQIGLVGMILFTVFFVLIIFELFANRKLFKQNYTMMTIAVILSIFIECLLSESAISIIGTSFYFIFAGILCEYISIYKKKKTQFKYKSLYLDREIEDKVGVILVNYNGAKYNSECIESIKKSDFKNISIYIVDNNSSDDSVKILKEQYLEDICLIENRENLGFSEANNIGIKKALMDNCEYILLLNNDTVIEEDMISKLIEGSVRYNNAVTAPKIYYYDNQDIIWSAGGDINWNKGIAVQYGIDEKDEKQYDEESAIRFATGCCILIPKKVINKVGFLSDEYFLYYEDTDYSTRITNSGIDIIYLPKAKMYHKVSASTGGDKSELVIYYMTRNRLIFNKKYNSNYIIAMGYFYLTFLVKAVIWIISGKIYIPKTMSMAIRDYYKNIKGKKF